MGTRQLIIRFNLQLKRWDLDHLFHESALFHRWLPNGPDDAIEQVFAEDKVRIALWFERHGYLKDRMIQFELDRHEIPEEVMDRQATLESGPLYGRICVEDVPEAVIQAVAEANQGNKDYVAFAKRLVKDQLHPTLSRFLAIIRYYFGQYWIRDYEDWDSREESLGRYCKRLGLEASVDGGATWLSFTPNEPTSAPMGWVAEFVHPHLFISQNDWRTVQTRFRSFSEPSLALQVLNYGHELLDKGLLRHALVEIITGLEITLGDFMRRATSGAGSTAKAVQPFYDAPLKAKVATLCLARGVDRQHLEHSLCAIEARNSLVHEAKNPPAECRLWLRATLVVCASFLEVPVFKCPPNNAGNTLVGTADRWDEIYSRRVV